MNGNEIVVKLFGLILIVMGFLMTRYKKLKDIKLPFLSNAFKVFGYDRQANEELWNKTFLVKIISYYKFNAVVGIVIIIIGIAILVNKVQ